MENKKLAIIKCINGNYFIHSEAISDLASAKVQFHELCKMLWSADDVITAKVMIVDEQLNCIEGYSEYIHHENEGE